MAHALAEDLTDLVGDRADSWDRDGHLPARLLRSLGDRGLLCAQVPAEFGGLGSASTENGEFTAHVGGLSGSLGAVMTAHGSAAWAIQQHGTPEQRASWLGLLTGGWLAAATRGPATVTAAGDEVVVHGRRSLVMAGAYADLLVVSGGSVAVVVPAMTPGVHVEPIADPRGCRAAGQAQVWFDGARVPIDNVLGGAFEPWYDELSTAWCCLGVLRACLEVFEDDPDQVADLYVATQVATRVCEHASRRWDVGDVDVPAVVVARQVAAAEAVLAAGTVARLLMLESAARGYRDARLWEATGVSRRLLGDHVLRVRRLR